MLSVWYAYFININLSSHRNDEASKCSVITVSFRPGAMKPKKNSIVSTNHISAMSETTLLNWMETKWHNVFIRANSGHSVLWIQRLYYNSSNMKWLNDLWQPDTNRSVRAMCLCWNHPFQCSCSLLYLGKVYGIMLLNHTLIDNSCQQLNINTHSSKSQSSGVYLVCTFAVCIIYSLKSLLFRSQCAGWGISSAVLWLVLGADVLPASWFVQTYSS